MSDPPIFVVGCPRSGTSLLRDLLRSNPRISIPPESHFIPRFYRGWGDPGSAGEATALARRILSMRPVGRWDLDLEPPAFGSCRSFAEVLDVLYGAFARFEGKPRWGDKTPHYVTDLPTLNEIFPRARFIHIVRDPRDVVRSWVGRSFSPGNVYCGARGWREMVVKGRADGAELGDRYMEVRYESLLASPAEVMSAVSEFVDEEYTEAMLLRADRLVFYGASQMERRPEIDPSRASRWRREMPASEQAVVESVAGDLMAELGYEPEAGASRIPAARRAWWRLDGTARRTRKRFHNRQLSVGNWLLELRAGARGRVRA